jgi:hypothetical protein
MIRTLRLVTLCLSFLAITSCVDAPKAGDTANAALYVYDSTSKSVKVWKDLAVVYSNSTMASPDREISGGAISNAQNVLGWGGVALDNSGNRLFLVFENGTVARIERFRTASGTLTLATDLTTFTLGGSSDRLSGGSVFGEASMSPGGTLYVTETPATSGSTGARIWAVANAGSVAAGSTVAASGNVVEVVGGGDIGCTGVAAGQSGAVYALFGSGNSVYDNLGNVLDGVRVRATSSASFNPLSANVLIGSSTLLGDSASFGSLAYDSAYNVLYATRTSSTTTNPSVLVFTPSQFTSGIPNQAPTRTLADTVASLPNLRILAHGGNKDWLAGADWVTGTGSGSASTSLYLWKNPSAGGLATRIITTSGIRGLAIDGNS